MTRSPWVVGASVLLVLGVVFVGATELIGEVFRGTAIHEQTLDAVVPRLELRAGQGDVTVLPSTDGRVHVRAESWFGVREPLVTAESGAAGVRLASRCLDGVVSARCETRWTVAVPPAFAVAVESGAQRVRVQDLTGPVSVDANSDVELSGLAGEVTARTGFGDVVGAGLRSPALAVATRGGDVDLALVTAPRSVSVTGHGDVALAVPGTRSYRVDTDPGPRGERRVTVAEDPAADATLYARTTMGDIAIRPL